jgi:hypothetical protein
MSDIGHRSRLPPFDNTHSEQQDEKTEQDNEEVRKKQTDEDITAVVDSDPSSTRDAGRKGTIEHRDTGTVNPATQLAAHNKWESGVVVSTTQPITIPVRAKSVKEAGPTRTADLDRSHKIILAAQMRVEDSADESGKMPSSLGRPELDGDRAATPPGVFELDDL